MFIVHCPVLDLCTCGETFEEAQENFADAYKLFFSECVAQGTLVKALTALGWKVGLRNKVYSFSPPVLIGRQQIELSGLALR